MTSHDYLKLIAVPFSSFVQYYTANSVAHSASSKALSSKLLSLQATVCLLVIGVGWAMCSTLSDFCCSS